MKFYLTALLLFAFLFFSCNDTDDIEEEIEMEYVPNCIIDTYPTINTSDICTVIEFDTMRYCEKIVLEDPFLFSVDDRQWAVYYCNQLEDKIGFVNSKNEKTDLIVKDNKQELVSIVANGLDKCSQDEDLPRYYCLDREQIISELYSDVLDHLLYVSLTLEFERPFDFPLQTKPRLSIYSNYITHYEKNNVSGEDGSTMLANNLFLEKAVLVGKTFYNVYSYKYFDDTDHIQMFVNKQYGIVGFRNYDGTMWRLDI